MQNFQIKIQRIYTDMNGAIVDKTLVPAILQKKVPFYLFNLFDKNSGFLAAQTYKQVQPGMFFLYSYVKGNSYNFLDFQITNVINSRTKNGDVVIVLGDDPILPNFLCHVILHSDYVGYGSFLANMQGKNYKISKIQYVTDNEQNWQEIFNKTSLDDFGLVSDCQIQPLTYRDPYQFTNGFLIMQLELNIDDKTGLNSYMLFDTDNLELTFDIDINLNLNNSKTNGNTNPQAVLFETR